MTFVLLGGVVVCSFLTPDYLDDWWSCLLPFAAVLSQQSFDSDKDTRLPEFLQTLFSFVLSLF